MPIETIIRFNDHAEIDDEDVFQELIDSFSLLRKKMNVIAVAQKSSIEKLFELKEDCDLISTKEIVKKRSLLFDQINKQQNETSILDENMTDLPSTCSTTSNLEKINEEYRNLLLKTIMTKEASIIQPKLHYSKNKQNSIFSNNGEQKKVEATDFCFLFACTNKMSPYIKQIQATINGIVNQLKISLKNFSLRIALVGYRDYSNVDDFVLIDFLDDIDTFRLLVSEISAFGGNDECEDILIGLNEVTKLDWLNENRLLFHICSATDHDNKFVSYEYEDKHFNSNHPLGLEIDTILYAISSLNIDYYFIETNSSKKSMYERLNKELIKHGKLIDFSMLDGSMGQKLDELKEKIHISIVNTIYQNKSKTSCSQSHRAIKNRVINPKLPKWDDLSLFEKFTVEYYTVNYLNSYSEIKAQNTLSFDPYVVSREIWIYDQPFAKGVLRFAYPAVLNICDGLREEAVLLNCVIKESISLDPRCNTKSYHEESLEIQVVSNYLANKFEQINRDDKIRLKFLDVDLIKVKETGLYYTIEEFVEGVFKKWSNNEGYVNINDYAHLLNAFSHWTFDITDEYLIVTDLQGFIYKNDDYILTDPAILCVDDNRFGSTNLGLIGIKHFFANHRCNQVCKKLKLKRNSFQILMDDI